MTSPSNPTTTAADQLARHGITGPDLNDICHAIAHTYIRKSDSALGDRTHDLAQFLALTALTRIPTYDPTKATIRTWLWNQLEPSCYQWHRRKGEGFGDRRYGQDNRVMLTDDVIQGETEDYDFDHIASQDRVTSWRIAAQTTGWSLEEWIVITLDHAAQQLAA